MLLEKVSAQVVPTHCKGTKLAVGASTQWVCWTQVLVKPILSLKAASAIDLRTWEALEALQLRVLVFHMELHFFASSGGDQAFLQVSPMMQYD